jgi:uncharacterized delta-60 repeat protein
MTNNVVFIDRNVEDYESLIATLDTDTVWYLLDADKDGILQMQNVLAGYKGLDSIHIISHGNLGTLELGAIRLTSSNINAYHSQLQAIGSSLIDSGDILLYGCNVGLNEIGQEFISTLASITGADVAASNNLTGATALGGDGLLEQITGTIETSALLVTKMDGVLIANTAPTFGVGDGKFITDFGGTDAAYSLKLQPDGKILVAGSSDGDFALARFHTDGSLDKSFGTNGLLKTDFGAGIDEAYDLTIQPNGKILLVGVGFNVFTAGALARYENNGSLDAEFDTDGKLMLLGSTSLGGRNVTLQSDGKILVSANNGADFMLLRYNEDGSLDNSFSADGRVLTSLSSGEDSVFGLAIETNGNILVAGYSQGPSNKDFAIARFNSVGTLLNSSITEIGSNQDYGRSLAIQSDGKILVAGYSVTGVGFQGGEIFTLARYNTNLTLDTSFDNDGKITSNIGGFGYCIALQSDEKILVGGTTTSGDFVIVRYNSNGSQDTSFGVVTTNLGGTDIGYSMAVQSDDKIMIAGSSGGNFALVRYNSDGSLDTNFDANILNSVSSFTENGASVLLDGDATINDAELLALNAGLGNYAGTTLTLNRKNGASAQDIFSFDTTDAIFTVSSGDLQSGGQTFATFNQSNGTLNVHFTSTSTTATQSLVNDVLRHIAYQNTSDNPLSSIQIEWNFDDGNTGTQGTGGSFATTGISTVNLTAVNDAPTASSNTLTTNEDVSKTLSAGDFGFSDVDSGDTLQAVTITSLPTAGSLTLNGNPVTLNQSVSVANINSGLLVFTPAANVYGTGYANFGFKVSDGTTLSVSEYNLGINVTTVNDAPTASSYTLTTNEDVSKTLSTGDFGFSDVDSGDTLQSVSITSLPTAGSLTLNGNAVTLNQSISAANISSGLLVFTPTANAHGAGYANFGFKVSDGTALSASEYSLGINVTAINDAPTASSNTITTNEDTVKTLNAADFGFSDVDSGDTLQSVSITSLPTAGSLTLNGNAVTLNQSISAANINSGLLVFTPTANAHGVGYANFGFKVSDGTALSTSNYSLKIDVANINDPPTLNAYTIDYVDTIYDDEFFVSRGNLIGEDLDSDSIYFGVINGGLTNNLVSKTGKYGTFSLNELSGAFTFTPNDTAIEGLKSDAYEEFDISISDGLTSVQNFFKINLSGANDLTSFSGDFGSSVSRIGSTTATGKISASDRDNEDERFIPQSNRLGLYGVFSINTEGVWSYDLNKSSSRVSALKKGIAITETFILNTIGGENITITVLVNGSLNTTGKDKITAGVGDNTINAGNGTNKVTSGMGNDTIDTGTGNDTINAGDGNNTINAGAGANKITTGNGDDTLLSGDGKDTINAGGGNNTINAGGGSNKITSGSGLDHITTGNGNDTINAGDGDNTINAGAGNNKVTTGNGHDIITAGDGNDTINAGSGNNTITAGNGLNKITSGSGDDVITIGNGKDTILAGDGNNTITSGAGNDKIVTGAGNDVINAGAGKDVMTGGAGDDVFVFDNLAIGGIDKVLDFDGTHDLLKFNEAVFTVLADGLSSDNLVVGARATAHDSNDFLLFDSNKSVLSYDADGNGAGVAVAIVTLAGVNTVHADDFWVF